MPTHNDPTHLGQCRLVVLVAVVFISACRHSLHLVLGRPLFLLPWGCWSPYFMTRPYHLKPDLPAPHTHACDLHPWSDVAVSKIPQDILFCLFTVRMGRHCAAYNCRNGDYWLDKWRENSCQLHSGHLKGTGSCICPPPFLLVPFPTEARDPERRRTWIQLISRYRDPLWKPSPWSRVCSDHFEEGNPNPSVKLDCRLHHSAPKGRKSLTERSGNRGNISNVSVCY